MVIDNSNLEEDELPLFESTQPQSNSSYVNPEDNDLTNITDDEFTEIYSESPITPSSDEIYISSHQESLRHEPNMALPVQETGDEHGFVFVLIFWRQEGLKASKFFDNFWGVLIWILESMEAVIAFWQLTAHIKKIY